MSLSDDDSMDPLALSYDGHNTPIRPSSATKARSVSPAKQSQVFRLETPGRDESSVAMTDLRGTSPSPWRIKVTVEAEPDAQQPGGTMMHTMSPSKSVAATRTFIVPTKTGDEEVDSPRRRRRLKATPPAQTKKRTNLEQVDDTGTTISVKGSRRSSKIQAQTEAVREMSKSPKKSPKKGPISKVARALDFGALTPLHKKIENAQLLEVPDLEERWGKSGKMKSVKGRVPTPQKPRVLSDLGDMGSAISTSSPGGGDDDAAIILLSEDAVVDDDADNCVGMDDDTILLDQSLVESENFSMVSIDALRNHKQGLFAIDEDDEASHVNVKPTGNGDARGHSGGYLLRQALTSTASSTFSPTLLRKSDHVLPSPTSSFEITAPNKYHNLQVGIALPSSSPSDTSIPGNKTNISPNLFAGFGEGTRRELKRGLMIGELMARGERGFTTGHVAPSKSSPQDSRYSSVAAPLYPRLPTPADSQEAHTAPSSSKTQANYPEIVVNHDTKGQPDEWGSSSPAGEEEGNEVAEQEAEYEDAEEDYEMTTNPGFDNTQRLGLDFENDRERVLGKVKKVDSSQIMLIDSDEKSAAEEDDKITGVSEEDYERSEDAYEQDQQGEETDHTEDIWQQEAGLRGEAVVGSHERSHSPVQPLAEVTPDLRDFFVEDIKPPRSKLPRTWRRTSGNDFLYSDEVDEPQGPSKTMEFSRNRDEGSVSKRLPDMQAAQEHPNYTPVSRTYQDDGVSSSPGKPPPALASAFADHSQILAMAPESSPFVEGRSPDHALQLDGDSEESFLHRDNPHSSPPTFASHLDPSISRIDTSGISTSDVRQLRRELASTTPRYTKVSLQFDAAPVLTPAHKRKHRHAGGDETDLLQPARKYPRLFDDPSTKEPVAAIDKANPGLLATSKSMAQAAPTDSAARSTGPSTQTKPGFLTRIAGWMFVFRSLPASNPFDSTASSAPTQNRNPVWTNQHWHLLHFLYSRSMNLPASAHDLPSRYFREPLPSHMLSWVGHEFRSTSHAQYAPDKKVWVLATRDTDVRTAHAFMVYAANPSAGWTCESQSTDTQAVDEYRKRVYMTAREDWSAESGIKEILRSVFAHRLFLIKQQCERRQAVRSEE